MARHVYMEFPGWNLSDFSLSLQESLEWAAGGKVKCNVEVRGFSEINAVLDQLRSGSVPGRIVVDMSK